MQQKPAEELLGPFREVLRAQGKKASAFRDEDLIRAIGLLRERADFVSDLWDLGWYLFEAPTVYDEKAAQKQWKPGTSDILQGLSGLLSGLDTFESSVLESQIKSWIEASGLSFGQVMPPLRLVLVGSMQGPHLFDIMGLIGKEETLGRISRGIVRLDSPSRV